VLDVGGAALSIVTSDEGDVRFLGCPGCGAAATLAAAARRPPDPAPARSAPALTVVPTPGATTMATAAEALALPVEANLKTMAYEANGRLLLAIVAGDRAVDEVKLAVAVGPASVERLDEEGFARHGLSKGFLGPHDHPEATVVADLGVAARPWWAAGANLDDHHVTGLVVGRDVVVDTWADLVPARDGDPCPACGEPLRAARGLVVARDGRLDAMGVVRAVTARTADDDGPVWPRTLAPFEVAIVLVTPGDPAAAEAASVLHDELAAAGIAAYLDDRAERAGRKFADAGLLGSPVRVTVGARGVAVGIVEVTTRRGAGATSEVALTTLPGVVLDALSGLP
jgi:prolyl-tRNA synthetase